MHQRDSKLYLAILGLEAYKIRKRHNIKQSQDYAALFLHFIFLITEGAGRKEGRVVHLWVLFPFLWLVLVASSCLDKLYEERVTGTLIRHLYSGILVR